jgi:hypothetical protein
MMRFVKFLLVVVLGLAFRFGYAQQGQLEEPFAQRDLSKTVHIFPNPAVEYVHVKVTEFPADKAKLTLHNIIGNKMDIETEVVDEHELRIRVKDLASGYYLLAIKDEKSQSYGIFKVLKR